VPSRAIYAGTVVSTRHPLICLLQLALQALLGSYCVLAVSPVHDVAIYLPEHLQILRALAATVSRDEIKSAPQKDQTLTLTLSHTLSESQSGYSTRQPDSGCNF
jgi:hypothetical protein